MEAEDSLTLEIFPHTFRWIHGTGSHGKSPQNRPRQWHPNRCFDHFLSMVKPYSGQKELTTKAKVEKTGPLYSNGLHTQNSAYGYKDFFFLLYELQMIKQIDLPSHGQGGVMRSWHAQWAGQDAGRAGAQGRKHKTHNLQRLARGQPL